MYTYIGTYFELALLYRENRPFFSRFLWIFYDTDAASSDLNWNTVVLGGPNKSFCDLNMEMQSKVFSVVLFCQEVEAEDMAGFSKNLANQGSQFL
jgi:hypothetical protein